MGKNFNKLVLFGLGTMAAWGAAIKPRTENRPDMAFLYDYDYADGGVHDFFDNRPENSDAAIRLAVNKGYGIAVDVRMSKDGVPVVLRDHDLWRLCGEDTATEDTPWADLKDMKLQETEENVMSLAEVLDFVNCRVPVIVKLDSDHDNYGYLCKRCLEVLDVYQGKYTVESEDYRVLRWLSKSRPGIVRGLVYEKQLSGGKTFAEAIKCFMHNLMLTNCLAQPDYLSVNFSDRKNFSVRFLEFLYHIPFVCRNVRNKRDYEKGRYEDCVIIFEDMQEV